MVAELLECGIDVDQITDSIGMGTMLYVASQCKHLDLVRFLLQRGASVDHLDSFGFGLSTVCWATSDRTTKHSSKDIYHVLRESTFTDLYSDPDIYAQAANFAASAACGSQIDFLMRVGLENFHTLNPVEVMGFAAEYGNYRSYSALLPHLGGEVLGNGAHLFTHLLARTILGKASYPSVHDPARLCAHDDILRDLLQRCGDGRILPLPSLWYQQPPPSVILSKRMKANELALGPETEAWYLGMVRSSGFSNLDEEHEVMQRLRELSSMGHVTAGFVYEHEAESDESEGCEGRGSEDWKENSVVEKNNGIEYHDTGINGGDEISTETEADEAYQFWDALDHI